jgi:hypothetical protein
LENYIKRGLRVIIVKIVEEEVSVVADSSKDQVKREDWGLGETSVENPLYDSVVINNVGEPGEKPREREGWDVS